MTNNKIPQLLLFFSTCFHYLSFLYVLERSSFTAVSSHSEPSTGRAPLCFVPPENIQGGSPELLGFNPSGNLWNGVTNGSPKAWHVISRITGSWGVMIMQLVNQREVCPAHCRVNPEFPGFGNSTTPQLSLKAKHSLRCSSLPGSTASCAWYSTGKKK